MKLPTDFDWIFFDCFNTLIDDFDESGDEAGLGSIPEIAVAHRLFDTPVDFVATYKKRRQLAIHDGREILLPQRLRDTLSASLAKPTPASVDKLVESMLRQRDEEYRALLRSTPGVNEMLDYWSQRKKLGVVSNFYLPHYPAQYLEEFGWNQHFEFILDSAAFGFRKPSPEIFTEALRLAGLVIGQGDRVLMIGDRYDFDIYPAHQLGWQTLYFNRKKSRPHTEEPPEGTPQIYDWSEFR